MILYGDTSALAKLVIDEPGTAEMFSAVNNAELLVSVAIAYVELRAAVAVALRDGRLSSDRRNTAMLFWEDLWQSMSEVPVDRPLLRHAGDLAESMRLRSYDAVHLAALLQCGAPGEVAFACWDTDLRRVAGELGYSLIPS